MHLRKSGAALRIQIAAMITYVWGAQCVAEYIDCVCLISLAACILFTTTKLISHADILHVLDMRRARPPTIQETSTTPEV